LTELTTIEIIFAGCLFGLTAGISPGPLLTLVLTETIKHNRAAGIKIAVSPLIADLPIILLTYFLFSLFTDQKQMLSIISVAGGMYLAYLGYHTLRTKGFELGERIESPGSLFKGIIANFLNPHPFLFWATIGIPYIYKAREINLLAIILFLLFFYVFLIGSKILIAILAARSKSLLKKDIFIWILRFLGLTLIVFSLIFLYEGISYII